MVVKNKLRKIYKSAESLFPGIDNYCRKCNTCCRTYGWILKEEVKNFLNKNYPVIQINNSIYCIDSFEKNKNGKRIVSKVPKCIFYKNKRCLIYEERPLDCRIYPIKIKIGDKKSFIGLSLGCQYIRSLSKNKRNRIYKNISNFFKNSPRKITNSYLDLIYKIYFISKPKRFLIKKLLEIKKTNKYWRIRPIKK